MACLHEAIAATIASCKHRVSGRAFALAAPHIWNGPPDDVISADSLLTFRRLLKLLFISTILSRRCLLTLVLVNLT